MVYADYAYYRDEYLGATITDEAEYARLARRATEEVEYYTFGRSASASDAEAVKNATCAVAEVLRRMEESDPTRKGQIQSERLDEYSVTHVTPYNTAQGWEASRRRQIQSALRLHLAGTGLLYAGVGLA